MNNDKKLYRIAENLSSDLYSYQDGETDINIIYKTLEKALYNAKYYRNFVNDDHVVVWNTFCTICHLDHVFQGALTQYKEDLMSLICK